LIAEEEIGQRWNINGDVGRAHVRSELLKVQLSGECTDEAGDLPLIPR
jgi:hypothetical protein